MSGTRSNEMDTEALVMLRDPGISEVPVIERFFDVNFQTGSIEAIRRYVVLAARSPKTSMLVTPNVDHVVSLEKHVSSEVRAIYFSADHYLCDSKILARLARWHMLDLTPRTGTDRVADILESSQDRDLVIAVIGPMPAQTEALRQRYPGWQFVHLDAPQDLKRGTPAWDRCVAQAAEENWNILLACLSFPKQELFAHDVRAARQTAGGVIMCVGEAVDFLSGTHRRAPQSFQRHGLEWLHRLLTNPRRLWRRYLVEGPKIFLLYIQRRRAGQP